MCGDGISEQNESYLLSSYHLLEDFRRRMKETYELYITMWDFNVLPEVLSIDEYVAEFEQFARGLVKVIAGWMVVCDKCVC